MSVYRNQRVHFEQGTVFFVSEYRYEFVRIERGGTGHGQDGACARIENNARAYHAAQLAFERVLKRRIDGERRIPILPPAA